MAQVMKGYLIKHKVFGYADGKVTPQGWTFSFPSVSGGIYSTEAKALQQCRRFNDDHKAHPIKVEIKEVD